MSYTWRIASAAFRPACCLQYVLLRCQARLQGRKVDMEHTCYICTRVVIGQSAVRAVQVLMKSQPQLLRSQNLISQVQESYAKGSRKPHAVPQDAYERSCVSRRLACGSAAEPDRRGEKL